MLEMRLRGYVAPEDFEGTDTQRIQKALDTSKELDIGRVVLKGGYTIDETLWIHPTTDLVLENATLTVNGAFPVLANRNLAETDKHTYTFQDQYITIRGNGVIDGDVMLYNAFHVNTDIIIRYCAGNCILTMTQTEMDRQIRQRGFPELVTHKFGNLGNTVFLSQSALQ